MIRQYAFRGRPRVAFDLKSADDMETVRNLLERADVLIEGFRPGTMERLGLGPEELLGTNERLIYARMSGWGQSGPLSQKAGHCSTPASTRAMSWWLRS